MADSSDLDDKDAGAEPSTARIRSPSTTSIHVTALDGLVNVNSLFTIAVFVGLSLTTPGQRSLEGISACDAGPDVIRNLLVFEVVAFSFFLFSSLIAQGLKLAINLLNSNDIDDAFRAHINARVLRLGMLGSAVGSVMGCVMSLNEKGGEEPLRRLKERLVIGGKDAADVEQSNGSTRKGKRMRWMSKRLAGYSTPGDVAVK